MPKTTLYNLQNVGAQGLPLASLDRYNQVLLPDGMIKTLNKVELASGQIPKDSKRIQPTSLESDNPYFEFTFEGQPYNQRWKTNFSGLQNLAKAGRITKAGTRLRYIRFVNDFPVVPINDRWESIESGDLVIDPTMGSATTAYVAEQWGRRWITIDTSRVALALARTRLMTAKYPYYLLADSPEGIEKEAELTGQIPPTNPHTEGDIKKGFVYKRVPHITLKAIANNEEIDTIHEKWQPKLEPIRSQLNQLYDKLKRTLKAEIDEDAWSQLYSTISLPFEPPKRNGKAGKIAVKVINHYGDEVLKVYEVK